MKQPQSFKTILYHILEISPPDHQVSRTIQRLTIVIVGINTLALLLSFLDASKENLDYVRSIAGYVNLNPSPALSTFKWIESISIYGFWGVETIATAWFTVGFVLLDAQVFCS